jgi:hypothetical protein
MPQGFASLLGLATLDINVVELLAKHSTVRPAELTDGDLGSGKL